MDYPIHGIVHFVFDGLPVKKLQNDVFAFNFANSADPDEMPPYVAFHLGLHCLPKYLFTGIQNENS